MIIELDQNFQVVWHWDAYDHAGGGTQLDINRPGSSRRVLWSWLLR